MQKNILLTVAIPTYNRANTLQPILEQLEKDSSDEVEILISDDCSTDNTTEMVQQFTKKTSRFVYYRNKKNVGFNGNICVLYENARGKYIWYVCDDDTVTKGAIQIIINSLKEYNPTVAVYNTIWENPWGEVNISGVKKTKLYTNSSTLADYQPIMRTTFLSIVVLERRRKIDELKKTNYKDNIFFQLSLAVYLLSDSFRLLEVASKPIITRNVGYKYGEFFKFNAVDHLKAVFTIPHNLDDNKFIVWSIHNIPYIVQLYFARKLGLFQYSDNPTPETKELLHKYYGSYGSLLLLLPKVAYFIPSFLLKWIYFLRLYTIHGYKKAKRVYNQNINRIYSDTRKTDFTNYQ